MKTTVVRRLPALAAVTLLLVTAVGMGPRMEFTEVRPEPAGPDREPEFEWTDLFDVDGNLRQGSWVRQGWRDAVFVEDRISNGTVTDISALWHAENLTDSLVYNGPVGAPYDLGNAYVVARVDGIDLMLDVRIERLAGDGADESYIEVEFNHDVVALTSGHRFPPADPGAEGIRPGHELLWPFRGDRSEGDLLIRLDLDGRQVSSFEIAGWGEVDDVAGYHSLEAIENIAGQRCFGIESVYTACGAALRANARGRSYIANGDPEQTYTPDSFVEFTVNLGYLVQLDPDFTTVMVRTPEDIAFGSFRAFGRFSRQQDERVEDEESINE